MKGPRNHPGFVPWRRSLWLALTILLAAAIAWPVRAGAQRTTVLDRVVAVVGEKAILASDVDEEMRFEALQAPGGKAADNTPQQALDRVIDRELIDEQRALQPGVAEVSKKDVEDEVAALRRSIPACADKRCATDAEWKAVLAENGFTVDEVQDRVRERSAILKFIDLRFGVVTRVPNSEARTYYDKVLKPELERGHAPVPEFRTVAPRIRRILREQQVSSLLDQWLQSLRGEEHVRVLDAAYGAEEGGQ